jgi:hypothetical protein
VSKVERPSRETASGQKRQFHHNDGQLSHFLNNAGENALGFEIPPRAVSIMLRFGVAKLLLGTFEPVQQNIIMQRAPVLCLNNSEK